MTKKQIIEEIRKRRNANQLWAYMIADTDMNRKQMKAYYECMAIGGELNSILKLINTKK